MEYVVAVCKEKLYEGNREIERERQRKRFRSLVLTMRLNFKETRLRYRGDVIPDRLRRQPSAREGNFTAARYSNERIHVLTPAAARSARIDM